MLHRAMNSAGKSRNQIDKDEIGAGNFCDSHFIS